MPLAYSFYCKRRVLKFDTKLKMGKSTIKAIELNLI